MMLANPKVSQILSAVESAGIVRPGSRPDLWDCTCPCSSRHKNGDRRPSGRIWIDQGKVHCWCARGCRFDDWVAALGTPKSMWFLTDFRQEQRTKPMIVAEYDYRDEDGRLLFQVIKTNPKGFYQRRKVGETAWAYSLGAGSYSIRDGVYKPCAPGTAGERILPECRRVLYRLPELLASRPSDPVILVEGEKDAEALRKLGFTATCNPQGAGKWLPSFNAMLANRKVMVIPDNDPAGRDHAVTVVGNLFIEGLRTIRVHQWEPGELPEKGDISDWLAKPGNNCRDAIIRRVFGS